MTNELTSQIGPEPRPFSLGAADRMDAYKAAAVIDIVFKDLFLGISVECLIVCVGKYQHIKRFDLFSGKYGRIIRSFAGPVVFGTYILKALDTGRDILMNIPLSVLGIDKNISRRATAVGY